MSSCGDLPVVLMTRRLRSCLDHWFSKACLRSSGTVVTEAELQQLKAQNPRLRVISSRWVCARKNPEKVRSRIVAKDLATGSARKQGFSSPTPSHDALMIALIFLATRNMRAAGADIGHAFT